MRGPMRLLKPLVQGSFAVTLLLQVTVHGFTLTGGSFSIERLENFF